MKNYLYLATGLSAVIILVACGSTPPRVVPTTSGIQTSSNTTQVPTQAIAPTNASTTGKETGGEGGGGEAALVTYADVAQGFSINYPKPWTKDPAVKDGVKFDGDGTMSLVFVKANTKDVMAFATTDLKAFAASLPSFKQVGLDASSEVQNAVVLGFETNGISNVTGKTYAARGDRYYIALKDGRIAIVTVISPAKSYDREGIRDIALTLKVTK